jgi:hypothetical protein
MFLQSLKRLDNHGFRFLRKQIDEMKKKNLNAIMQNSQINMLLTLEIIRRERRQNI